MDKLVKLRYWWFALSLVIIIPGLVSLAIFGLRLGIDFSGGALWDIQFVERRRVNSIPSGFAPSSQRKGSRAPWCS